MLQKFELKGVHTTIDANLQKYVTRKLGRLDKYLPRQQREAAHAVVELKEAAKAKEQKKYTCAVTLTLPHEKISVAESTMNMYAAVDIVEEKLKQQIKKYKDKHDSAKVFRHLRARLRRKTNLLPEQLETDS